METSLLCCLSQVSSKPRPLSRAFGMADPDMLSCDKTICYSGSIRWIMRNLWPPRAVQLQPGLTSLAGMAAGPDRAQAIEGEVTQMPRQKPVLRVCSGSLGTPNSSAVRTDLSAWVAVSATWTVKAKFSQSHLGNVRSLPRLKEGRGRGSSSQSYWKSGPTY